MAMQQEAFTTLPLQQVIPSYLYQEYAQDDDLQAFVDAYNSLAQGYHDWFLQNPLGLYTAPGISGALLDWIALGVYGIPRPTLASQSTIITAGYDSTAYDTVPYNFLSYSASGSAEQTTDDIFKRILTWNLYRGDGQVFSLQWLKNRIARFLHGPFGSDAPVLNYQPSISLSGNTFTVTDFASADYTTLQLCMDAYSLAFPFQYQLAFTGLTFTNSSGVLHLSQPLYYPTSAAGLAPGSVWYNAGSIDVVPGVTPDPNAPAVYFGQITPTQLLTIGGGNLPTSNLFSVTNQPFGTGNGSTTAFQLSINGFPISSYTGTPQVFRADWQGNQLLYTSARTCITLHSQDLTGWGLNRFTDSNALTIGPDGGQMVSFLETSDVGAHHVTAPNFTPTSGSTYTNVLQLKPNGRQYFVIQYDNVGFGGGKQIKLNTALQNPIVSSNGLVSSPSIHVLADGTLIITATWISAQSSSIGSVDIYTCQDATYTASFAGNPSLGFYARSNLFAGAIGGSYIVTTTSAVTVTDYTLSGSGAVTTAVAPLLNASLTWTGTGVPHGSNQLWNNAGVVSIL